MAPKDQISDPRTGSCASRLTEHWSGHDRSGNHDADGGDTRGLHVRDRWAPTAALSNGLGLFRSRLALHRGDQIGHVRRGKDVGYVIVTLLSSSSDLMPPANCGRCVEANPQKLHRIQEHEDIRAHV